MDWSSISGHSGGMRLGNTKFNRLRTTFAEVMEEEEWAAAFWHSEFTGLFKGTTHYECLKNAAKAPPYPIAKHVSRQPYPVHIRPVKKPVNCAPNKATAFIALLYYYSIHLFKIDLL